MSPATAAGPLAIARAPHPAGAKGQDFALSLTALLLAGATEAAAETVLPGTGGDERQGLAEGGKDLPEGLLDTGASPQDEETEAPDIAFAWFTMPAPIAGEAPLGVDLPRPAGSTPVPLPGTAILPSIELQLPGQAPATAAPIATAAPATPALFEASAAAPAVVLPQPPSPPVAGTAPQPSKAPEAVILKAESGAPIRIEIPARSESPRIELPVAPRLPVQRQSTQELVQARSESLQQLAAPLILLQADVPTPHRRATIDSIEGIAATALGTLTGSTLQVAAAAGAQDGTLDMRDDSWMTAMIDQIEEMRDAGGTRETSIRLSPDSLGELDISIRHDGDKIHVRFNAESPAARALLAEAQPKLAELAEARGIRLGQTSVNGGDAGTANQGARQDAQRTANIPAAPVSAAATTETDTNEIRVA